MPQVSSIRQDADAATMRMRRNYVDDRQGVKTERLLPQDGQTLAAILRVGKYNGANVNDTHCRRPACS